MVSHLGWATLIKRNRITLGLSAQIECVIISTYLTNYILHTWTMFLFSFLEHYLKFIYEGKSFTYYQVLVLPIRAELSIARWTIWGINLKHAIQNLQNVIFNVYLTMEKFWCYSTALYFLFSYLNHTDSYYQIFF